MPRSKRCRIPGVPQLVFQVGHNGGTVFYDDTDYNTYLAGLKESALSSGCRIHAYSLAPDSIYILCTPTRDDGVSRMMQGVAAKYAYYFNHEHQRSGSLWDGRYRACLVEPGRFLIASYLFVDSRLDEGSRLPASRWSSKAYHARGRPDPTVDDHWVYLRLADTERRRQEVYRELLNLGVSPSLRTELQGALRSNVVLGQDSFKDKIASQGYQRVRVGKPGRPPSSASRHAGLRPSPRLGPAPAATRAAAVS